MKPCDDVIFNDGKCVFVTHTIPAVEIERFTNAVALLSEQPVDWHYYGGRARILTTGDIKKVETVIEHLLPIHDLFFDKAMESLNLKAYKEDYPRYFPQRKQK